MGKVIGLKIDGKLVHVDYQRFVPMLKRLIEERGSVRCLIEIADFQSMELRALGTKSSSTSGTVGRSSATPWWAIVPGRGGEQQGPNWVFFHHGNLVCYVSHAGSGDVSVVDLARSSN